MLTLKQILKVAEFIYQTETVREGTYHGYRIGGGPSCAYGPPQPEEPVLKPEETQENNLEKRASENSKE